MTFIAIRKIMYNSLKLIILSSLILIFTTWLCFATSLNLSWDANTEDDLAGYKVYYGTSSGNYGEPIDAGNVTVYELEELNEGITYYIAITAYDTSNNESEKSDEVSGVPQPPPDSQNPTITITSPTSSPTYSTSNNTINIGGTASDNVGVTSVTWSNDRGGSGSASGTTSWSVSTINLSYGDNVLTIIASDAAGNSGSDTLTATYTPPDTQNPTIAITSPTSSPTYSTSNNTITISGTASDNRGVTSVTWFNNRGGSGSASGTTSWTISNIPLLCGKDNIITITAKDAADNSSTDNLTLNVRPCRPVGISLQ